MNTAVVTAVVVAAIGLTACSLTPFAAPPTGEPFYRSSDEIPVWVTRRPDIPGQFVAVGIATGTASLEEGRRSAIHAAVSEIVTYLGVHMEVLFTETTTMLEMQMLEQIQAHGEARVSAGRTVEMYYEERDEIENGRPKKTFDVYVLLSVPYDELEMERARIEEELRNRRVLAQKVLQKGQEAREAGQFASALRGWLRLLSILQDPEEASSVTLQAEFEIARLIDDLEISAVPLEPTPLPMRVQSRVRLSQAGRTIPLAGIPLRFRFVRGGGEFDDRGMTGEDGVASSEVRSISVLGGPVILVAEIDMPRLLGSDAVLEEARGGGVASALERLAAKHAETTLVGSGDLRALVAGDGPGPSRPSRQGRPHVRGEELLLLPALGSGQGLVQTKLLAGHERIYAPRGRPQKCIAFVLEIVGSPSAQSRRRPLNLALILDGSGSMGKQGKMDYLKQAAKLLVRNLASFDVFSLITYGTEVKVIRPAGTVSDPTLLGHMIDMMRPSGTTNLGGGLIEGIRQADTYRGDGMLSRVVLVSDGLANEGITDASLLASYAARAADRGISTTTIGLGNEFNEVLLMAVANRGHGNYYYVDDPSAIPEILEAEMNGLAGVLAQNITVKLDLDPGVRFVNSLGIPYEKTERGIFFRVGQVVAGERIRIAFQIEVPPGRPGPKHFGTVSVAYDDSLGSKVSDDTSFPLSGVYTEREAEAERSANAGVNRYVHMLAIIDSMLLARESNDRQAIEEVLQYIEQERPKLQTWLEQRDDQEMRELGKMLDHCSMVLEKELRQATDGDSRQGRDLAKEISYKLYRLRHHALWEADETPSR